VTGAIRDASQPPLATCEGRMTQALGEPSVGLGGDAPGRVRRVAAEAGKCRLLS
jgi:hypothetical protein